MAGIFDTGIFDTGIFDTAVAGVSASATLTQAGNTVVSTGAVVVKASASIAQAGNTVVSTGAVVVKGTTAQTQVGNTLSSSAAIRVAGGLSVVEVGNTLTASAGGPPVLTANLTQGGQTVAAQGSVQIKATLSATQSDNRVEPPVFVVAPSYGHWAKSKNRNKPEAPKLPDPVQAGEVVIDEAVLRQMEEERLAALVLHKKAEALGAAELLRATTPTPEGRVSRNITLRDNGFDKVEASPETRRAVIKLFSPPPKLATIDPVRGSITLRALGPRHLPEPEIRKSRTISLRRSPSQSTHAGLMSNGR